MSKTTKPNLSNAVTAQDRQEKAIKQARAHLKEKGIDYPVFDPSKTQNANYEAMLAFAEQEAALVVQFMRAPSGERPLVLDTTASGKGWQGYND